MLLEKLPEGCRPGAGSIIVKLRYAEAIFLIERLVWLFLPELLLFKQKKMPKSFLKP